MCSEHFEAKHIVKTLCGITKPTKGTVPTIFNPKTVPRSPSQREKRMNERKKRKASEDNNIMFPAKISRVSPDVGLRDHDYVPKDNKVNVISSSQTVINANEVKEYVSVSCQTDIYQQQMEDLTQNVAKLRTENKTL